MTVSRYLVSNSILAITTLALMTSACGNNKGTALQSPQVMNTQKAPTAPAAPATGPTGSSAPSPAPVSQPSSTQSAPTPATSPAPESANKNLSYFGNHLTLISPNESTTGYIRLKGDDAKALYTALAVKTSKSGVGNERWLPTRVHQGYSVNCAMEGERRKPHRHEYACSFWINYETGSILLQSDGIEHNKKAPRLKENYLGDNLKMIAKHPGHFGELNIDGEDAQALYSAMDVAPAASDAGSSISEKKGQDITCLQEARSDESEYSCIFYFDYRNGAVVVASPDSAE